MFRPNILSVVFLSTVLGSADMRPVSALHLHPASPTVLDQDGRDTTRQVNVADVKFMQGMIAHHAQAIVMSALVTSRTSRNDLRLLAQRIDVSQKDEIKLMQRWLRARQQDAPDPEGPHEGHTMSHGMLMPGMLTAEQMNALTASTGTEFERLFLSGMIQHHQGAITMVKELFSTNGAGQDAEVFRFASDVDTDQRAEIARMQKLLDAMTGKAS
ncbi:MAG: DUF305 domain-containing protein [Gemmatimonadaceae bacterium]